MIRLAFLHLFIITMECIYMTFIRSQRSILTIMCVPVERDFHIPKVYLECVFNLRLHFGERSTFDVWCWLDLLEVINHSVTVFRTIEDN